MVDKKRALEAWRLRHDEGLTFKEIGQRLKNPVSTTVARDLVRRGAGIASVWLKEDIKDGRIWVPWAKDTLG